MLMAWCCRWASFQGVVSSQNRLNVRGLGVVVGGITAVYVSASNGPKLKNQLMIGNQLVLLVHFRIGQPLANTDWLCKSRANVRDGFFGVGAIF